MIKNYILESLNYDKLKKLNTNEIIHYSEQNIIYFLDTLIFIFDNKLGISDLNIFGKIWQYKEIKHPIINTYNCFLIKFEKKEEACISQVLWTLKYKNINFHYLKKRMCVNCFNNKSNCLKEFDYYHKNSNEVNYLEEKYFNEYIVDDLEVSFDLLKNKYNFIKTDNSKNEIILILSKLINILKNKNIYKVNEYLELDNSIKKIKFEKSEEIEVESKKFSEIKYIKIKKNNEDFLPESSNNSAETNYLNNLNIFPNKYLIKNDDNKWINKLFSFNQLIDFYNETFIYLNSNNKNLKESIDIDNKINMKNELNKSFYNYNVANQYEDLEYHEKLIKFKNYFQNNINKTTNKFEIKSIFTTKNERKKIKKEKKKLNKLKKKNKDLSIPPIPEDKKLDAKIKEEENNKSKLEKSWDNAENIEATKKSEKSEQIKITKKKKKRKKKKKKNSSDSINKMLDNLNLKLEKNKEENIKDNKDIPKKEVKDDTDPEKKLIYNKVFNDLFQAENVKKSNSFDKIKIQNRNINKKKIKKIKNFGLKDDDTNLKSIVCKNIENNEKSLKVDNFKKSIITNLINSQYDYNKKIKNLDKKKIWEEIIKINHNDDEEEISTQNLKINEKLKIDKKFINQGIIDKFNSNSENIFNDMEFVLDHFEVYDFNSIVFENKDDDNFVFLCDSNNHFWKEEEGFNKIINKTKFNN